jgi:hypothetical protein
MLLAGVPDAFFGEGNARFYPSIGGWRLGNFMVDTSGHSARTFRCA